MEKTNLEMIRGDTLSFAVEIEFDDKEQELEELRKKVLEANKQKVSEQEGAL